MNRGRLLDKIYALAKGKKAVPRSYFP